MIRVKFYNQKQVVGVASMRIGLVAGALAAQLLLTFNTSQVSAAPCVAPPLTPEAINLFKSNPQALIAPGADTRTLEAQGRDLAGTDADPAADLVKLADGAPPRFQTAIAAGLAQAAVACQTVNQEAALQIQPAVAGFEDAEFH